jgi:signal peptidase I
MTVGFALNEALALATVASGALALVWRARRRRAATARKPWWVSWGSELFTVVALVFGCRVALADWMHVPSGSMEPTLRVGDVLLINHLAYGPRLPFTNTALRLGQPRRGDVVVFRHPDHVSEFLVKRLVALPGDRVRFRDGVVAVNGEPLRAEFMGLGERSEDLGEMLVRETSAGVARTLKLRPQLMGRMGIAALGDACRTLGPATWDCTVPPGHVLMLGDHRDNSADSRAWGFLPEHEIYGRVDRVLVNFTDLSRTFQRL